MNRTLGHYRVLEKLGEGGMGEVYLAADAHLERKVALKVLPAEMAASREKLNRFEREARAVAALNHPNIVHIYSVECVDDVHFFTMELVEGEGLDHYIPPQGLRLNDLLELGQAIADALSEAHEQGIVHRDLKPANIMVDGKGRPKILDFGLAALRQPEASEELSRLSTDVITRDGEVLGTYPYMSPEQIEGAEVDQRSDIFSLGVVLYRMATGRHPFEGKSTAALAASILRDAPRPVTKLRPSLPADLDRILRLALEKDPEQRYQSAKDLRNELHDLEREISRAELLGPVADRSVARRGAHRLWWGGAAILLAALVAAIVFRPSEIATPSERPQLLAIEQVRRFAGQAPRDHLADGLAHTLRLRLGGLRGVYVVPTEDVSIADAILETDLLNTDERITVSYSLRTPERVERHGGDLLEGSSEGLLGLADRIGARTAELLRTGLGLPVRFAALPPPTSSDRAWDLYLRGRAAEATNAGAALALFQEALVEDPEFALPHVAIGEQRRRDHAAAGDASLLTEAGDACARAVALRPELAAGHLCLGRVRRSLGSPLLAVNDFMRAIELDPASRTAYQEMSSAQLLLGLEEAAEANWLRVLEQNPSFWAGYFHLGGHYYHHGDYERALDHYSRAAELAPRNADIQINMAGMFYFLGRYEEATSALQRAIRVRPDFSAYATLGSTYFIMRRFEEAVAAFEESIELEPNEYRVLGSLARALYWTPGRRAEAAPFFERAIELGHERLNATPDDSDASIMTAFHLAGLDRPQEALAHLDRALQVRPSDNHYHFIAGLIHNRLGDEQAALGWLERAVEGGYSTAEVRAAVDLDNLRGEPRFRELLEAE